MMILRNGWVDVTNSNKRKDRPTIIPTTTATTRNQNATPTILLTSHSNDLRQGEPAQNTLLGYQIASEIKLLFILYHTGGFVCPKSSDAMKFQNEALR